MKLDKKQQKQLTDAIRLSSGKRGYKIKSNAIYTANSNAFVHCDFLIVNSQKMLYRIYIKNYDYDDIFWRIMQMPDNSNQNDSLRAIGAFKAPSVLLRKGDVDLTDEYEEQADCLVKLVDACSHNFMEQHNIDEYIINCENGMDKEILKCLAYIHMKNKKNAIKVAKDSLDNGNRGNYENEGKSFFEWVLMLQ